MESYSRCWLLVNPASGTNDDASQRRVEEGLASRGIEVARILRFPEDALPQKSELEREGIGLLVIFTGDGTINGVLGAIAGWTGSVLVLPGGTMNLLARRLHRELEIDQILDSVAQASAVSARINVVRSEAGTAYAGLLVGPGTCWAAVRESMREIDVAEVAKGAIEALRKTANGPPVEAPGRAGARAEGYPLLELTPGEYGIEVSGYYAEHTLDMAEQAWATLRRRFREGPHDRLGLTDSIVLQSSDGGPLSCLIDGEPAECSPKTKFEVALSEVNLLATSHEV